MKHGFKEGASLHIYLAGGKDIMGTVVSVSEEYVHLQEKRPDREQPLNVYINYLHISHVYID